MRFKHKITVFLISIVLSTLLCWFGKIDGAMWTELTKWLTLSFIGANVITKAVPLFKKGNGNG